MREPGSYRKAGKSSLGVVFSLLAVGYMSTTALAQASSSKPSEQWILRKVAAGEDANLKEKFPNEADRIITSSFLKKLLSDIKAAKVQSYGVRISNATVTGDLDLRNEEIPYETSLTDCIFDGAIKLASARFKSNLSFDRTTFRSEVEFARTVVNGRLGAARTHFEKTESEANFEDMKIAGAITLDGAVFDRPVRFYGVECAGFNVTVDNPFYSTAPNPPPAHFNREVTFELMQVKGHAFFVGTFFWGHARFYGANITANFEVRDAFFKDPTNGADFEGMRVGGYALFWGTTFDGPVKFASTTVGGRFETDGAHFNHRADFGQMSADSVGFLNSHFAEPIVLSDMTYQRMSSGGPDDLLAMIGMIRHPDHFRGAYVELEKYYRRIGNPHKADEMYIMQRRLERANLPPPKRFGSWILDKLVRYGRRPWRASVPSAIVVVLGWFFFFRNRRHMEPQRPEFDSRHYSGFLYSLDLFLPLVDLQAAGVWMPRQDRPWARRYLPIHILAGWVLATILAAALTGVLR